MSEKSKLTEVVFKYKSHDEIQTELHYIDEKGKKKDVIADITIKIDEEKSSKYFTIEKNAEMKKYSLLNTSKKVLFYNRLTAALEIDPDRKKMLEKVFQGSEDTKNVLFVETLNGFDVIKNIDTTNKSIAFKISNKTSLLKNNFENFENIFFSAKTKQEELDFINSIRFSYISYSIVKEMIDKVSKNVAIQLIRDTNKASYLEDLINDIPLLALEIKKYYLNTYFKTEQKLNDTIKSIMDNESQPNGTLDAQAQFLNILTNKRTLRSQKELQRVLDSDIAKELSRTIIPLKNDIDRYKTLKFDTILLNQENAKDTHSLAEFYKDNMYGTLCVQSGNAETLSRNSFSLEVDKSKLELSLKASLSEVCAGLNKVLDLRTIDNEEHREKILSVIFSSNFNRQNENMVILSNNTKDVTFMLAHIHNGNAFKVDNRYLGDEKSGISYIVDIANIDYTYNLDFKKDNSFQLKKIIEFPKYDEAQSLIKNLADAKDSLVDRVISQREMMVVKNGIANKIDGLGKFELIYGKSEDFSLMKISKEYETIKKTEEFYDYAKTNLGSYFANNFDINFSSFNVAKDKKIFNNDFYYNVSNSTFSIQDLESIPLASHISKTPLGDTISKIAKKFNIHIQSEKPFSLSDLEQNRLNVGRKDFVTTDKLGAMKFGYLPKSFELKPKDKEILVGIIKEILDENPTIDEFSTKEQLQQFEKTLDKATYLMMKNEQTIVEGSKIAPKEILVLIDENLKDISKVNIPISDFYNKLEEKKIFDINDYIEVLKPNTLYLEKVSQGLTKYLKEFKEEHKEALSLSDEVLFDVLEKRNIKAGDNYITPFELLISDANKVAMNKKFYELGQQLNILKYYEKFLNFESSHEITDWVSKQKLSDAQKEAIINVLEKNFIDKEIFMIEQKSKELLTYFQKVIGEDKTDIFNSLDKKLHAIYHHKKTEFSLIVKTVKLYVIEKAIERSLGKAKNIDKELPRIEQQKIKQQTGQEIKKLIDIVGLDIMGLTNAQYKEALHFSILKSSNIKDTQYLLWTMRMGKSRASMASQFFSACSSNSKELQRNEFFILNKTMDDIAEQLLDFMPVLAKDVMFNSDRPIYMFKPEKSLELPVNISKQIAPQLIKSLKKTIKFQGQKKSLNADAVALLDTYTQDMVQIQKTLDYYNYDDLEVIYEKSPFIDVLKLGKMKKVDKEVQKMVMQSFLYIQMIFEKKYLKVEDKDIAVEKVKAFVEKYINSKEKYKTLNPSKMGIDIIPKSVMYSINVDSPITNIDAQRKTDIKRVGKSYFETPYRINIEDSEEIALHGFSSLEKQKEFLALLESSIGMPKQLKEASKNGILYRTALTYSDGDIISTKEALATNFIYASMKNANDMFYDIMEEYIKKQNFDSSLSKSIIYKIDGLDEQLEDTIEVNLNEIFKIEKLEEFLKNYEDLDKKEVEKLMTVVLSPDNLEDFTLNKNKQYYKNALYSLYDTTQSANIIKRIELVSPLLMKKYKDLAQTFVFDMELLGENLIMPLRKEKTESGYTILLPKAKVNHTELDIRNLANPIKKDLTGLQMQLSYVKSVPMIVVKKEQDKNLMLDLTVKKNENLNTSYNIDLRPDISSITIDEGHKGLGKDDAKKQGMQDVVSYLHSIAKHNKGMLCKMSGTPTSGYAEQIGKLMSSGKSYDEATKIIKYIKAYCTTYEFKDNFDAIIFSALEIFPNGAIEKALSRIVKLPTDITLIKKEYFELSTTKIEGIREEIKSIVESFPVLDITEKEELIRIRNTAQSIIGKFEEYKKLFKIDNIIEKTKDAKTISRVLKNQQETTKEAFSSILPLITKIAPGINNYSTLADILRKIGTDNSINISRPSDNLKYEVLDNEIIKRLASAKDVKTPTSVNIGKFKDRTLALSAYLEAYRKKLNLGGIKERVNEIFNAWVVEVFSEDNIEKTFKHFGFDEKYNIEDMNFLISKSGKTVKDSVSDIFNIMYFGSDREKFALSENEELKDKVKLVIDIIDNFVDFSYSYATFQHEAHKLYEIEKEQAKNQDREIKKILIEKNGLTFDASSFADLTPDIKNVHLFQKSLSGGDKAVVTLNGNGDIRVDGTTVVFKIDLKVNKWENILNEPITISYSLTNQKESEILEYLASDATSLYKHHIDKSENTRLMSTRNALLAISFLDGVQSLVEREDKSKKAILIINRSSTNDVNYSKLVGSFSEEQLKDANVEIKITQTSSFAPTLYEVQKNKNNQIVVVGNYVALAEGIDMSCVDTGFYIGSLTEGAEMIQSFARQQNTKKEVSSFYLILNGLIEKLQIKTRIKTNDFSNGSSYTYDLGRLLFNGNVELITSSIQNELKSLQLFDYDKIVPSVVTATVNGMAKLRTYEYVMSGKFPKEDIDYKKIKLLSFSTYHQNMEKQKIIDAMKEKEAEVSTKLTTETNIDGEQDVGI